MPTAQREEDIYQLKNITQLKDSCIELINQASNSLLADVEPGALEMLRQPLLDAVSRGVEVMVKLYEPADLPGVKIILRQQGQQVYDKTADRHVSVCSDGRAMIVAVTTADMQHVIQAFKTQSPLMSLTVYNKLVYEFVLTQLNQVIPTGDIDKAQSILKETEHLHPFSSENAIFSHFKQSYESQR